MSLTGLALKHLTYRCREGVLRRRRLTGGEFLLSVAGLSADGDELVGSTVSKPAGFQSL